MKYFQSIMLATSLVAFSACAQSTPINTADKEAVEKVVYDYLMENPEVVMDALLAYEKKQDWDSIEEVKSAIYGDSRDVVIGPKNAKVTIVEFFDYNCGFCKKSTDWVVDTIEKYPNDVRVIFKETPILRSPTSEVAARAALAAARQGKYMEMHVGFMNARSLSEERIDQIARENGVNVAKMRKDMEDPKIADHVDNTMTMIRKIRPFNGTPFFLFDDEYVAGASVERLDELLQEALSN